VARGVLSGFVVGAVLSGAGLGALSIVTGPPPGMPGAAPQAESVEVPEESGFNQPGEDTAIALPGQDDAPPEAEVAPPVDAPAPDDTAALGSGATETAAQPETGLAQESMAPPEEQESGLDQGSAQQGGEQGPTEPAPGSDSALETAPAPEEQAISTDPAQPAQPVVEENSGMFAEESAVEPEQQAADPEAVPEAVEAPAAETGTIGNLAENVTTNRLPSVGAEDPAQPAEEPAAEAAPPEDLPPLERFAAPFENPEGKPLMSIVLIDDGESPISFEALADFPYPVSYAVDASWEGAAEAAARYRSEGLEVLLMANLPEAATPTDTEIAMQAYLGAVPEAVAVMEGVGSGLQQGREVAQQLAPILLESGHGLVLFSEGLETARNLIAREGVPVATIFRDIDGADQNATVIRRFLDQAAFKAGQSEEGVIMLGRLRAETVSALLLWGLQDRAASVALAPVSAVLKAQRE
jgi:polysaccharide deacetylase 2 family uncharacterized protein YibQ